MTLRADAAVVGGGAAGLAAALAIAQEGFSVTLVAPPPPASDGRTVALLDGSVRLLRALGAWEAVAPHAAPLATLRIVDDTGSLFRPPPVRFTASEIGLDAFGWNVEAARLAAVLREAATAQPGLTLVEGLASGFEPRDGAARVALADASPVDADLVVAADGARSRLREAAGIASRRRDYPQGAVTTILAHARAHDDTSTEFHTREGPFTLVPLPGGRRSSLVWVARTAQAQRLASLDDAALAGEAEARCGAMLGAMRIDGARGLVPMRSVRAERLTAPRLALVGEAAHVFPPIGAQGLNLGLRDAATLRDVLVEERRRGGFPGSPRMLDAYERARRLDVTVRSAAVDLLNRGLLADLLPVDLLRGAGLLTLGSIGPLRRLVMREGVLPHVGAPLLMRR